MARLTRTGCSISLIFLLLATHIALRLAPGTRFFFAEKQIRPRELTIEKFPAGCGAP
jgi:hypothetical protein